MVLILGMSLYLYNGVNSAININQINAIAVQMSGPERAQSLKFRLDNEAILSKKARQQMVFGWGGYGRNRVYEKDWKGELKDITVTDSLWIISFGVTGLVGLISSFAALLVPAVSLVLLRYPARTWTNPKAAPGAVLAVIVTLYMLDCVLNAMTNPIFALASGAMAGTVLEQRKTNQLTSAPAVRKRSFTQPRQS
jgi:hypothetical protein